MSSSPAPADVSPYQLHSLIETVVELYGELEAHVCMFYSYLPAIERLQQ